MAANNHTHNREIQQDARAWSKFTGTNYTAALRQMRSPLAQGLLGDRVSARQLIAVLDDHELIGTHGGDPVLDDYGFFSDAPWSFDGETDFINLALITDMLRMFTPTAETGTPEVGSYSLKHTAERFLRPHCSHVSNGRLIWAAAALGLRIVAPDGAGPNLLVGVSEREHDYVSRMVNSGSRQPRADHFRPLGYTPLQTMLEQYASGGPITGGWHRPAPVDDVSPFHDWLILQAGRNDAIGDFVSDYVAGVRDSDHRVVHTPGQLLTILHEVPHSPEAYEAAVTAIAEWMRTVPSSTPVRTEQISGGESHHQGWGAGAGTAERYEYRCPCGDGTIIEQHDNVPGFREHDVWIACDKCSTEWRFVDGQSVRQWGLEPVTANATI